MTEPSVFIVDDDKSVREALLFLMKSVQLNASAYASAKEFLTLFDPDCPGCLVSDIRMPGMSGLELLQELQQRNSQLPIIFITGHGDVPMAVGAIKNGAEDFLTKPFRDQELLDCINTAIDKDKQLRSKKDAKDAIIRRLSSLTNREKQVLDKVVAGKANKVIAADLSLSHRTVEVHRSHVMEKMQARSLAELVKLIQLVKQEQN
ncbi:MAG: response regulator transcription factor [Pseudomonadales bacterium]|nr:response regulator transcription factor [Pseudomonadales bacterium]